MGYDPLANAYAKQTLKNTIVLDNLDECLKQSKVILVTNNDKVFTSLDPEDLLASKDNVTVVDFWRCLSDKVKNDPRITTIGKFLRKTSLDELPQFLNVLRGDMSIIGPRPIVKEEKPKYGKYLKKVLSVKPGITGLWQVSGRNNLTYNNRVLLDLNYVRNSNFIMDLRILIRTFGVIFFPLDRGAY